MHGYGAQQEFALRLGVCGRAVVRHGLILEWDGEGRILRCFRQSGIGAMRMMKLERRYNVVDIFR